MRLITINGVLFVVKGRWRQKLYRYMEGADLSQWLVPVNEVKSEKFK